MEDSAGNDTALEWVEVDGGVECCDAGRDQVGVRIGGPKMDHGAGGRQVFLDRGEAQALALWLLRSFPNIKDEFL